MLKKVIVFFVLIFFLISCGAKAKFIVKDFDELKPEKLAILPAINKTNDVEGAEVFRKLTYLYFIRRKAIDVIKLDKIDRLLNEEGITQGGQLSSVERQELCSILNVDGLIYVKLLECEYSNIGVSSKRKIKSDFKLYKGNELLWQDGEEISGGKSFLETAAGAVLNPGQIVQDIGEDFIEQNVEKMIKGWVLDHELRPEMTKNINESFKTLPLAENKKSLWN